MVKALRMIWRIEVEILFSLTADEPMCCKGVAERGEFPLKGIVVIFPAIW
jgi:hypothetical protein